jgi:hypothetical protein
MWQKKTGAPQGAPAGYGGVVEQSPEGESRSYTMPPGVISFSPLLNGFAMFAEVETVPFGFFVDPNADNQINNF